MLTSDARVGGVAFTGSTETALLIRRSMAEHLAPGAPLIAETGGLNAMIVDSTALPEKAVEAVIESAFQSAGQRCSALRCLYVQEDIAGSFKEMLFGAIDELVLGDPWQLATDSGPVIDQEALDNIAQYVAQAESENRVLKSLVVPAQGTFFAPTVIEVGGIEDLEREIFGPVLHFATFRAGEIDQVIENINATGYGLTFGLQTRIDDRVQHVCENIRAGNIYVNRNQIGAIVGSQPFGGNGLSGTRPKAGGPHSLDRFHRHQASETVNDAGVETSCSVAELQQEIDREDADRIPQPLNLPGPTGESNQLSQFAREPLLCLGPGKKLAKRQAQLVRGLGGVAIEYGQAVPQAQLAQLNGFAGVLWWGDEQRARQLNKALAEREGAILPLITGAPDAGYVLSEQHVCVDTTASGGNTELLAGIS
jgi:RHH-type proline utilization regulon transcriptional repressor/proline dehydrogenase/delta 1-pyrroline-5-carboxylate dehydrogenase